MPAKRIIILSRPANAAWYKYVLWADVPAGNQIAYRCPTATSAYENATPAELQAIRDGLVAEKSGQYQTDTTTLATIETYLQSRWNEFQTEVTALVAWTDYGRYWNGTAWTASAGVPMYACRETTEGLPTFFALTPVTAFAANKFQFVLHNSASTTLGQAQVVKIRLVAILPGLAAVTGVAPSAWSLQRRQAPTTSPSGAGSFSPSKTDSAVALPAGIACYNAPGTAPAGGTLDAFCSFVPQADELKLTTADAPTQAAVNNPFAGMPIYKASELSQSRPLTVRAGETLEVVQSATGGTGNCQVLCVFTVG